jgi:hypothetical protein
MQRNLEAKRAVARALFEVLIDDNRFVEAFADAMDAISSRPELLPLSTLRS